MKKIVAWPYVWICWYAGRALTKLLWNTRWHTFDQWHPLIDEAMIYQDWAGLKRPWRKN